MFKNYHELKEKTFFSNFYLVADTKDFLAEKIFSEKYKMTAVPCEIWENPDSKFVLVLYKVKKKDKKTFIAAIEGIETKALLLGYRKYKEFCEIIFPEASV